MAMLVVHEEYVAPVERRIGKFVVREPECRRRTNAQDGEEPAFRFIENYFLTTHTKLIQKAAPCVLVLATIWATIAAIALFDIQPSRGFSIAEMFPPGHNGRLADELRRDLR